MKRQLIILVGLIWACCQACSSEEELPVITPDYEGVFVDGQGRKYPYVRYGHLEWMTKNFDQNTSGSAISHEEERNPIDQKTEIARNLETFGRLYTYNAAQKSAPEGWRLPTEEDWQDLERHLGMPASEANSDGWRGTSTGTLLQQENGSGVGLRFGGMGEEDAIAGFTPYFIYVYGFYWTATSDESGKMAYCRQISYKSDKVARALIEKGKMLSVRYVRDAQ